MGGRSNLIGLAVVCVLFALGKAGSAEAFAIERYSLAATGESGAADKQAASHPYELTAEVALDRTGGEARSLDLELPAGLTFKPDALTQCTDMQLAEDDCPDGAAVGVVEMDLNGTMTSAAVYDMAPSPGEAVGIGFKIGGIPVHVETVVRTGSDFGLTASMRDVPQREISLVRLTLWGVPGEASHNAQRGSCLTDGQTNCEGAEPGIPFLTLPDGCAAALSTTARASSWQEPAVLVSDTAAFGQLSGCDSESFEPTIHVEPDTPFIAAPAGYEVEVGVAPGKDQSAPTAQLKDAQIVLPTGTSLNLGTAEALEDCSEAESALTSSQERAKGEEDTAPASCPEAARVGDATIRSAFTESAPEKEFEGGVYVLHSSPPNVKFLVAASADGVNLKLVLSAHLNEQTGQIALALDELPQLEISDIRLAFFGGENALFTNPQACGVFVASSDLEPWSGGPDATPSSSFELTAKEGSDSCASPLRSAPSFSANMPVAPAKPNGPLAMKLSLSGTGISIRSGRTAVVRLECSGTSACSGTLALEVAHASTHGKGHGKHASRRIFETTIGSGGFSIPPGKTTSVTLELNRAGRELLKTNHGRLDATLRVLITAGAMGKQVDSVRPVLPKGRVDHSKGK